MMQQLSYETIEPLIEDTKQNRNRMSVTFVCPMSGQRVEATATMEKADGMGAMVRQGAVTSLMWQIRRWVRRLLGRSMGRMVSNMIRQSSRGVADNLKYSGADKNKAVVDAFRSVQSQFRWNEQSGQWTHQSAAA